jgi:hypothetical protein
MFEFTLGLPNVMHTMPDVNKDEKFLGSNVLV